jgi:uncharacterized protein
MRALVVNAAELLRRPGSEREVEVDLDPAEIELADERLEAGVPIVVRLHLESLSDGIVVDGEVISTWHGSCRRCLTDVGGRLHSQVHEIYQGTITDPEAFPIEHDQIDLAPVVREVVQIDLPVVPVCRPDCAGLCPTCGVDRNLEPCQCADEGRDDRWDALEALRAELGDLGDPDQRGGPGESDPSG